jgi:lysophospholipase L1-like esterase
MRPLRIVSTALLIVVAIIPGAHARAAAPSPAARPAALAPAPTGRPIKIMPLGDSITFGVGSSGGGYRTELWRQLIRDAGVAADFVGSLRAGSFADPDNEGHSGWTIAEIAGSVDGWLATYQPDVVLLHIGTNDMVRSQTAGAPERLSALLDQITNDVPAANVVVSSIIPTTDSNNSKFVQYNARIPGVVQAKANAGKHVVYTDMYSTMTPSSVDFADTVHPNDAGYAKMAAHWYAALEPILAGGRDWPRFASGLESGEVAPTWTNTMEGTLNVGGYCCGLTGMEAGPRTETSLGGTSALMYSGNDTSGYGSYSYAKVFDTNIKIASNSVLSYWIYPQQANGTYVAIDMIMTDSSSLRDSGLVDQYGVRAHPQFQGEGGRLVINRWNLVTVKLGALAGRTIDRINLGYDQPANTGPFRGYVDSIAVIDSAQPDAAPSALVNLALKQPASAAGNGCVAAESADRADDGVAAANSKWCAGGAGIFWQVDLGSTRTVSRVVVRHASAGGESVVYNTRDFRIQTSPDNATWQTRATVTGNADGITSSRFAAVAARYVRLIVDAGTQNGEAAARIYEVEAYQ